MTTPTSFPPAIGTRRHPTIAAEQVPERRGALAILSHLRRDADWILPRHFRIFTFWGNAEIDLTHALVGEGTSVIEVKCIMGNVEIHVPPDLRVENEVEAVLASADIRREAPTTAAPGAPTVRVTGSAFLGNVEVKVVDPDAPGLIEKIRRRLTK
jgi:cell wall-active antibiotic response 4TMS protein YvqF